MTATDLESAASGPPRSAGTQTPAESRGCHERFRRVFESAPLAIGISDADGKVTAINPAFTRMFGYTLDDIPTLAIAFEHFHPDPEYRALVAGEWAAAMEEYRRTKLPGPPLTTRLHCKDGSVRVAEVHSASSDDGESLVMFNDITDQVCAQEAGARAEVARVRAIGQLQLQSSRMPMALVITDANADLTIREWHPGAERIFGYGAAEVVGRSPFGLIIPAERKSLVQALVATHVDPHETVRVVNENITKDGRRIWCEWFNTPIFDATGRITAMMSMADDISERLMGRGAHEAVVVRARPHQRRHPDLRRSPADRAGQHCLRGDDRLHGTGSDRSDTAPPSIRAPRSGVLHGDVGDDRRHGFLAGRAVESAQER